MSTLTAQSTPGKAGSDALFPGTVPPPARVWAEIDRSAWRANYRTVASAVAPAVLMPVVKANAYGMGDIETARAFRESGCRFLAVSCMGEGMRLIDQGLSILLLGASLPGEIPEIVRAGLIPSVPDLETAECVSRVAGAQGKCAKIHIKVDTGMGRFGMPVSEARASIREIAGLPNLELHGIFSHFAAAGIRDEVTMGQLHSLAALIRDMESEGIVFRYRHIANSTAIAGIPAASQAPFTMVRSGIDLHGGHLSCTERSYATRPVFNLKARLLAVRHMPQGATVGYGRTYRVSDADGERIGIVSIGYADGYPRYLSNKGTMLVRGRACPITGIVCMDYTMISLRNAEHARPGDEVVVIGRQGESEVPISEVARAAETIPYELMCGLGSRVKRYYIDGKELQERQHTE